MEPRARAGKNVGKMNFGFGELRQLLYGSGDAREPLPETMRLLDEIATDFIQSLSFEAARIGHYSGRQKIKYEDFEFALRRNPLFLGKVREMFEMSKEVKDARKMPGIGEGNLAKADINDLAKLGEEEAQDKNDKGDKIDKGDGSHAAGNSKKRAKGDGAGSKKKKAKTAAANKAADEARAGAISAGNAAKTASASAEPAESIDIAAKEEPDLEEPSGLDALFGDDDDDVDFGDEPANGNKNGGQANGTTIKNEDDLGDLDDDLEAEMN
ncbi:transcription initiation factor tfiid subunit [Ophiostoma piceae UAMH 11346]|uniref:Transcription initiation factor TFIID subunit 13 n=1 Tax=Ophiostoma piceae (strain UAMH 11346) TaxID=1262450 RepID=S3BTK8_OPHP1|nr:transcription initiation factor tfiid subunit [Ophiostoma piceae UAMH 11346]